MLARPAGGAAAAAAEPDGAAGVKAEFGVQTETFAGQTEAGAQATLGSPALAQAASTQAAGAQAAELAAHGEPLVQGAEEVLSSMLAGDEQARSRTCSHLENLFTPSPFLAP